MSDIDRPEPAFDLGETAMLRAFVDHYRATIRLQASSLADEDLTRTLGPSDLTLGGMLSHLAFVEDYWCSYVLASAAPAEPWASADWESDPDWDWHFAGGRSHAELDAMLVDAVERSDRRLDAVLAADPDLGQLVARARPPGKGDTATVRWMLVHLVEEYARHAGHADLIRQSIDGATDV